MTYRAGQGRPAGLRARLRALAIRMATEHPTWRHTRIQGALKNLGHPVGRSTIARILRVEGMPPGRQFGMPTGAYGVRWMFNCSVQRN